jgi:large subunit ribosomal protein L10
MAIKNYTSKKCKRNIMYCDKIRKYAEEYKIIGIVDITGLPAKQFQRIRASLNKKAKVLIVKKNLIELVLKELESKIKGISKLTENITGMVGIIFTNDNPFKIFKFIKKNKSSAPAKAGSIAPNDIIVPAGPTSFAPGPIIGELGALKIKAGINAGKVEIKEDSLVAKEGEVISSKLAGVLTRLEIEPMEVGLNIKKVYENGTIFDKNVLDVDEDKILEELKTCSSNAFNLSLGINYVTKNNISYLIGKAEKDSISLALGIDYPSSKTIKKLITKASINAGIIATKCEGKR